MTITIGRRGAFLAAVAAAVVLVGGVAYATIPDSQGVIHACYHVNGKGEVDANSTLRVIDASSPNNGGRACKNGEVALDFNQQGPPGTNGSNGTNGTNGTNGVSGYEIVSETHPLPGGDPGTGQIRTVSCPAGKKATGGGIVVNDTDFFSDNIIRESGPIGGGTGWKGHVQRTDDRAGSFWTLSVICVTAS